MEDTHGALKEAGAEDADLFGLNPYYNGRYSWSPRVGATFERQMGLNPYYNGRYSWSYYVMLII